MEAEEYAIMRAAEDRHWWYAGVHDLILRIVRTETRKQGRPLTMLDAGCGTGRLCQLLQPLGDVAGCDLHPLAVTAAAARGVQPVWQTDLVEADLGADRYDLITAIDVLYHRAVTDEERMLANLRRALRPGGCLLVQVAAFEALRGTHDVAVHTRRRYRRDELVGLLKAVGFKVELASYRLCPLFLPAWIWRARSRAHTQGDVGSDVALTGDTWANGCLTMYLELENRLVAAGVRLPFGTSIFACARK
jgi:SAM-dependent methyltransferase